MSPRLSPTFQTAPPSVASWLAALLEPAIVVGCFLGLSAALGHPLDTPELTLCVLVGVLAFPGRNRFAQAAGPALADMLANWLALLAVLVVCGYVTRSLDAFDHRLLLTWAVFTPLALGVTTLVGRQLLRARAFRPGGRRRALIVGAGPLAARVVRALQGPDTPGHDVLGCLDDRADAARLDADLPVSRLGRLDELADIVRQRAVHDVFITLPLGARPRAATWLAQLQGTTASVYLVPDVPDAGIIQGRLQDLNGVPVVGLCDTPFTGLNRLVKRLSDIVLASLILLLIAPLLALIAIAVRLDSPGPAIFRQRRNGLDGEEIVVYKFRTMRVQDDGAVVRQATRGDPRITRLGAWLRRSSLDELPQFVNVLQGRMSVVGPRPHAVAHNDHYRDLVRAYMVRHKVKPGITGWAQVNGCRGETETLDKMQARVAYDLDYLRHWSLGLDLLIIVRTVRLVLADRHAY